VIPQPVAGGDSIRIRNMNEWMSLAQRNTLDLRPGSQRPGAGLIQAAAMSFNLATRK
jgi:hypothetical protein